MQLFKASASKQPAQNQSSLLGVNNTGQETFVWNSVFPLVSETQVECRRTCGAWGCCPELFQCRLPPVLNFGLGSYEVHICLPISAL